MYSDLHVHTHFSNDSSAEMVDYCKKAIAMGMKQICFTDHVDAIQEQHLNHAENVGGFFTEFFHIKNQFFPSLLVFSGFEFSEPHKNHELFYELQKYPFDYRMCSVHHCANNLFPSVENIEAYQAFDQYLTEVDKTIAFGEFDALGHIDLPLRYFGFFDYDKNQLESVLTNLINKGIALEINTSIFSRSIRRNNFDSSIVDTYLALGGKKVVIGSDAHSVEQLGTGFKNVYEKIPSIQIGYFSNRTFIGK